MAIQRDKIVASAEKLVGKGKIEAAIKEYERLLDDNPNDVNTLNRIGDLWVRVNRTDEAVKVYTRIADHYAKDGFFLKAIAIFKKINKLDPSRLEIYARLADLYAKQGLAMEAKSQYQVLADYYLKHGDPDKALKTFQKIAELDPNSINVHVKLADLYSQNNQTAEALREYDRVGRMLLKRGMADEAVQVFRKALKIDPGNTELAESLANTLIDTKDFANARTILEGARDARPDEPKLMVLLGRVYTGQGDIAAAERILTEGVARHPGEPQLAELLADLFLRRGNAGGALNILEPLVDAAATRGDRSAVELLQRIARVDAAHIPTLEKLVSIYEKLNEETNILSSMNSLAEAHISGGNYEDAAAVLERLIRREPENAQHREKLAFVRERLGGEAAPAPEPPPAPPLEPPVPRADIETELDFESMMPPPLPTPTEEAAHSPSRPSDDEEDLDFITEQLTEAEVFAKYGLTEKAIEHLERVLQRAPGNPQAHDKLLHVLMDEGAADRVAHVAPRYFAVLRERGDLVTLDTIKSELVTRGFDVADSAASATAPSHDEAEELEVEMTLELPDEASPDQTEPAAEEEVSFGGDGGIDLEAITASEPEIEIDFDIEEPVATAEPETEPYIEPEAAVEEATPELEVEPETAVEEATPELEVEPETAVEEATPELEIELDETLPEFAAVEDEVEELEEVEELQAEAITGGAEEPAALESDAANLEFDSEESSAFEIGAIDEVPLDLGTSESVELEDFEKTEEAAPTSEEVLEIEEEPAAAGEAEDFRLDFDEEDLVAPEPAIEELGEIDFYLEQELFSDAADRIAGLQARFPGNGEVARRQAELERMEREAEARTAAAAAAAEPPPAPLPEPEPEEAADLLADLRQEVEQEVAAPAAASDDAGLFADEDDFFDLAAELESELADEDEPLSISEEEQSLEQIFKEFKRGVEQQLDSEDYDTHYNLGIAYKEMGLIDEAIGEFQLASKDPKRMIECCSMLGLCFLEKGMPQLAIKWYQKGLEAPEITDEEHLGLLYDLGSAYLEVGDTPNAQKAFLEVYGVKSNYRDIVSRIKQLEDLARQ